MPRVLPAARRLGDELARAAARPHRLAVLATVVLVLALPQLYLLPRGSVDIALGTVVALLLAPVVLLATRGGLARGLLRLALVRILLALLALRLLALAWSPEPRAGLQSITLLGQFVVTVVLMVAVAGGGAAALRRLHLWYWPWVLFEAALVVGFRLLPGLEDAYLHSIGGFFAGQNTVAALFGDNPNNVLDPAKAGGVFINANVAAMFLGVNGLAAFALAALTGTRWLRVVGVLALLAVPFTGSKSATVLVFALPAAAYAFHRLRRYATPAVRRYLLFAAVPLAAAVVLLLALNRGFLDALVDAFVGRTAIWQFGAEEFRDSPLLGLGYGGWDVGFAGYADRHDIWRVFPPHNILLGAWAVTGLAGLVLTVAFFVAAFRLVVRRLSDGRAGQPFVICAGTAIGWILVQGLGENTDVFGDIHLIPIVSLLIAYLVRPVAEETQDSASHPDRGSRTPPAVPAVGDVHHQPGPGDAELPPAVRGEGPGPEPAASRLG
ncbi:O-antigen ligase family protein [Micromonospora sp. WMMD1102]|uniref:O-antigen ligase family protein n=1 Tax=Micromonospora sp. WMMD1102 TaxID=3016105 RepID=UPI002414FBD6|nr:O-antigen ligase family protein [Micromonospora sp. WMMD1102]MDG4786749.1 O-antigen ligase family protein [Micromonospora sp. WMMD1102]